MRRFFVNSVSDNTAVLSAEDSSHAVRVLRLQEGEKLIACDGCGSEFDAVITSADKAAVKLALSNKRVCENEAKVHVTLIQCLPKSGKMELIIQKCVELGVYDICPVISERSLIRLADEKSANNKVERYNRIAYEAAKQSQRGIIPRVNSICALRDISVGDFDLLLIPYECESEHTLKRELARVSEDALRIGVVIGPEGGFDIDEISPLINSGAVPVTLGKRILRTETAGMATLAALFCILEQ